MILHHIGGGGVKTLLLKRQILVLRLIFLAFQVLVNIPKDINFVSLDIHFEKFSHDIVVLKVLRLCF